MLQLQALKAPTAEVMDANIIEAPIIINRTWTSSRAHSSTQRSFRIATYNVLTDLCIQPGQYSYCPYEIRYMEARHLKIMAEVKDMSPDIICFQVSSS
jgi:mRNA deadenylase 3'-5' endonuclease subunit Ccr4